MQMKQPYVMDIECYRNYFLVKFRCLHTEQETQFAMWEGNPLNILGIEQLLKNATIYTFNGTGYDLPILSLALTGATNGALKDAGDDIITGGLKWWDFYRKYGIQQHPVDHVDVMEVAAGVRIGLKMYAGRIHAPKMQDLPIEPGALISPVDRVNLSIYCSNDLDVTQRLVLELQQRLTLREQLSAMYGVDLRSKSDAQIAEAVIKAKLPFTPNRRYISHGYTFKYEPPAYIKFATPQMQQLLETVRSADFVVSDKEQAFEMGIAEANTRTGVLIPDELKGRDIVIGNRVYRMGIGGLHSQEACESHYTNEHQSLVDVDVTSYYPSLILTMGMYPEQLGPDFLRIYREVYDTRLEAKPDPKRKAEADGLKIVLNGTFGKLFSKYSIFYAPEFGIATTLTGQLALLMLIEMMELSGIRVASANTDGIVLIVPKGLEWLATSNVKWWERTTGLGMEESHYRSIHSRDVNNYIAITSEGKVKRKGVFAAPGLLENKHPDKAICADAVVKYLKDGTPIERTIRDCTDIRQFLVVRAVSGGGAYNGQYLGKAVRWYYGMQEGYIQYVSNGNKVAGSDGATPIMQLPTTLPTDINYDLYINIANEMLAQIGVQ